MIKKGGKLYSISRLKCPRCNEGELFKKPITTIGDFFHMPDNCPKCKQAYYLEVGFYWGAMYVAYALSSIVCFGTFFLAYLVLNFSFVGSCIFFTLVALVVSPYVFKLSRALWLNMFVKYDKNWSQKVSVSQSKKTSS